MTTATRRRSQPAPGWESQALSLPVEELDVLRTWHPNVLIRGRHDVIAAALEALRGVFRPDVVRWNADAALPFPPDDAARTLILHDVDALSPEEQRKLLRWLREDSRTVQIVATTTRPVWPLVESGNFDGALYYALNVVSLVL